jgi:hypothetical protein
LEGGAGAGAGKGISLSRWRVAIKVCAMNSSKPPSINSSTVRPPSRRILREWHPRPSRAARVCSMMCGGSSGKEGNQEDRTGEDRSVDWEVTSERSLQPELQGQVAIALSKERPLDGRERRFLLQDRASSCGRKLHFLQSILSQRSPQQHRSEDIHAQHPTRDQERGVGLGFVDCRK